MPRPRRVPHTPRLSQSSNVVTTLYQQPYSQTKAYDATLTSPGRSRASCRRPSNLDMGLLSTTASSQSFSLGAPSASPGPSVNQPSNTFIRPPSTNGFPDFSLRNFDYNAPSPSPSSIFNPNSYSQYSEFLAPSPTPSQSSTPNPNPIFNSLDFPILLNENQPPNQQQQQEAYSHFCLQIHHTFQNMAIGLLGAKPGIQIHQTGTTLHLTEIPPTRAHHHLALKTLCAISHLCKTLPLPPQAPLHERGSREDISLDTKALFVISFPHSFSAAGEMRSGITDYFSNTERELKKMCGNWEWGFLARRCRRAFAVFVEELEGFGFETVFL